MSTDYEACCENCKIGVHLGQRMADKYSLGYGPGPGPKEIIDKERKIMEWIAEHIHMDHRVVIVCEIPDDFKYEDFDEAGS